MQQSNYIIEVKGVSKFFGDKMVLDNINLYVKKGEFVTVLGPSGCGKTTLLRLIAGFQTASEGEIKIAGKEITQTPPHKRPVNTVFQKYALFPHLNVFDNIAFGLKLKKTSKQTIEKKVKAALRMVGMTDYEYRDVNSLSGGQQQRVAIARAIVNEPEVLLLDEPLAALDLKMRKDMQMELKEMHKTLGITFIYVTHDQEEALTLSDTIVVMSEGKIQQIGTPVDIYNEPINSFVADFIGESNILNGTKDNISFVFIVYIFPAAIQDVCGASIVHYCVLLCQIASNRVIPSGLLSIFVINKKYRYGITNNRIGIFLPECGFLRE